MTPSYEQIERGAKAMFNANALFQLQMIPVWGVIDQGERTHWLHLSNICLLAALTPAEDVEGEQ